MERHNAECTTCRCWQLPACVYFTPIYNDDDEKDRASLSGCLALGQKGSGRDAACTLARSRGTARARWLPLPVQSDPTGVVMPARTLAQH